MSHEFLKISGIIRRRIWFSFLLLLSFHVSQVNSQSLNGINIETHHGLMAAGISPDDSSVIELSPQKPFFSFLLDGKYYSSADIPAENYSGGYLLKIQDRIRMIVSAPRHSATGLVSSIQFDNTCGDTLSISNFVPFGESRTSVYITDYGTDDLARACLFRPGSRPLRVILPDNAWETGYSSFYAGGDFSVCSLARRQKTDGGQKKRYETILPPKATVYYNMYIDIFRGEWQEGLKLMFRDRYLYDLGTFNNALYERSDLTWIRESYLIVLEMAWQKEFYDRFTGRYNYSDMLKKDIEQFGSIDVFGIWPTWPRLGLDRRNQWDLYHDLPGGTLQLRNFARLSRQYGTRLFISYNPWDNSTRKEDQLKGMARTISETEADGVILDTRGSSSTELQAAADSVRKGVVMYSEGMAVVKDMPGIVAGRVHDAIILSPELNLNKLIKPEFAIFRVCDVGGDIIHREIAISFFNGYGTELNMFRPGGRNDNFDEDMHFLACTTFILRQNSDAFLDKNWTPLIETLADNVYVNRWKSGEKTIYTILNMQPGGINGSLFSTGDTAGKHYVSIWNHENLEPALKNGRQYLPSRAKGWEDALSGTRKEGSVDCIAEFPDLLKSELAGDSIKISYAGDGKTLVWKGNPGYGTALREFRILKDTIVRIKDLFGYYEGKIVVQQVDDKKLKDEDVLIFKAGKPWLVSRIERVKKAVSQVPGMVLVPGTAFSFNVKADEDFIPYPDISGKTIKVDSFLIDKYPVTNAQYFEFITATGYVPSDTTRYLKDWESGTFRQGQDNYPVVYLSYEDMKAYAKWAGKRLPTEAEWQLAAQGTDKRKWPWGDEFHGTYCNNAFDRPTPVDAFSKGQSPYGAVDLVGNVWQMTGDLYFNGTDYFAIIRGGSYYKPDSSQWYLEGGPQPLDKTQMMLMVSQGFDRCSTVGFRCVKDIESRDFKGKK